jgi:hypothetical protein
MFCPDLLHHPEREHALNNTPVGRVCPHPGWVPRFRRGVGTDTLVGSVQSGGDTTKWSSVFTPPRTGSGVRIHLFVRSVARR